MGNPSVEVTEENREAAQVAKSKAMYAISEGMTLFLIIDIFNSMLLKKNIFNSMFFAFVCDCFSVFYDILYFR